LLYILADLETSLRTPQIQNLRVINSWMIFIKS
jgi:hypothetical protein